ncbi:MAG: lysylphosphatidylglycerol synthase transmembrane domain-containing protein [Sphaerobacter sp.]|nr:lysylphosphatidylglycerol synthase transmembrane domain-containing protein [Sphaerobacter sp.]
MTTPQQIDDAHVSEPHVATEVLPRHGAAASLLSDDALGHNSAAGAVAEWDRGSLLRRVLRPETLVSFGIAAAVVVFLLTRFDLNLGAVLGEIRQANLAYLAIAFAIYYGAFAFRAARWRLLLESAAIHPPDGQRLPGLPGLSAIFVLSWSANCIVPAKLGDAYRGFLLRQRARTSFGATVGTIVAERLVDLVTLAALLVGSAFVVFGSHFPSRIASWMLFAVGLGVVLVAGLVAAFLCRHRLRRLVPRRVRAHYLRVEQGLLGSFGRVPTVLGLTAVIWLMEGARLYFVSLAIGASLSIAAAIFIALLASLLTVVPVTPAGLGFVELGIVGSLTLLGMLEQTAASVALLDRVVAYWSVILVGAVLYVIIRWRWR